MQRLTVAVLLLVVALSPAAVPGGFVLCVHADGARDVEPAGSLCCETGDGGSVCEAEHGDGAAGGGVHDGADPCVDFPLASAAFSSLPAAARRAAGAPAPILLPIPPGHRAAFFVPDPSVAARSAGPPGGGAWSCLRSVVLRC